MENNSFEAANVMLIGRTGVGKSSLLNYLVDREVCKTGCGKPVTQDFEKYVYEDDNGFKINIFDSKGLEVQDFNLSKETIKRFVQEKCTSNDIGKWLHTIFYCINVKRARLEEEEIKFIKSLSDGISQTIHIILTHCNNTDDKSVVEMTQRIRLELGNNVRVFGVNSVEERTRVGIVPQFGREEVLSGIFKTLWNDISKKIALQYSMLYCKELKSIVENSRIMFLSLLDEYSTIGIIKKVINDDFSDIDKKVDDILDDIGDAYTLYQKRIYEKHLAKAVKFFNQYYKSFKLANEDIFSIDDFHVLDLDWLDDMDKFLDKTQLGKIQREFENVDEDSIISMLGGITKAGVYALRIKSILKDVINSICNEIICNLPSENKMCKDVENVLLKPLKNI